MKCKSIVLAALLAGSIQVNAQQLAFPGAEGFGRFATGGRGGSVYHVTNLNDSGEGSFRDAVSKSGRTIVFDTGGVIKIKDKIKAASRITSAGQTAPGEGIVVYGNGISFSDSSIIRHIRFRGSINMARGACTLVADSVKDIIFDHVSVQWGRWDNLHIKGSNNVTMQYCLIGEAIDPQRFGALFEGPTNVTIHHCLWIDNQSRNPKAKAGIEFINNVVYNWSADILRQIITRTLSVIISLPAQIQIAPSSDSFLPQITCIIRIIISIWIKMVCSMVSRHQILYLSKLRQPFKKLLPSIQEKLRLINLLSLTKK